LLIFHSLLAREVRFGSVKFHIGVPHRLWFSLPDHHLQIGRLEAVVLKTMNDSGGA
jgi:hypothetical protein